MILQEPNQLANQPLVTRPVANRPVRAAVIGVGAMGRNHARVYSHLDGVELVGIADSDPAALEWISKRFPTRTYPNYNEMLAAERVDIASITVPTGLHEQVACDLMARGVHVLVEKPLAADVIEGERIIEVARQSGVCLGVGHIERFNPAIITLKRQLESGHLGRVFQIMIRRIGPFPARIKDVGVFLDLATHDIDVMNYLIGSEVVRVATETAQLLHTHNEDLAASLLRFANGVIGVLVENWTSPTKIRDLSVSGERGMFVVDFLAQDLYFFENNYTASNWDSLQVFRGMSEGNMTRFAITRDEPLRLELEAFVRAVTEGMPFPVSSQDALRAVRIAERLAYLAKAQRLETKVG